MKRFSIVTVVLNDRAGLARTGASVVAQSNTDYEWIVVDGGSSDGTLELARKDPRVTTLIEGPDKGIYDAMNKGIRAAFGEYVVFLNAGDPFANERVLDQVAGVIETEDAPDVVCGGALLELKGGRHIYRSPKRIERYIWHGLPAIHQATYYRTERVKQTPYDLRYSHAGDYQIIAALYREGVRVANLNEPLTRFEVGEGLSFQKPERFLADAYVIQRDVLGVPLILRVASYIRRMASIIVTHGLFAASRLGRGGAKASTDAT